MLAAVIVEPYLLFYHAKGLEPFGKLLAVRPDYALQLIHKARLGAARMGLGIVLWRQPTYRCLRCLTLRRWGPRPSPPQEPPCSGRMAFMPGSALHPCCLPTPRCVLVFMYVHVWWYSAVTTI